MENQDKEKEDVVKKFKDEIDKDFSKIKDNSPNARLSNQMSAGSGSTNSKISLWQPHNFRRYFLFSKVNFNSNKPIPSLNQPHISYGTNETFTYLPFNWDYEHKNVNYGSEHHYYDFMQCNIKVKKNQVEITNKALGKQWFKIERDSLKEIDQRIEEISNEMEQHCIRALGAFIELHGGASNCEVISRKSENKIKGDEFIDKIPARMTIHDTIFKKVYLEKNIEYYDESQVKQHVKNIALNDFAPEIAQELSDVNKQINEFESKLSKLIEANIQTAENTRNLAGNVDYLAININSHISTIQSLDESAQSQTKSAKTLSKEVKKIADALNRFNTPPKQPKKSIKTRKYGLTEEEMEKIRKW